MLQDPAWVMFRDLARIDSHFLALKPSSTSRRMASELVRVSEFFQAPELCQEHDKEGCQEPGQEG